MTVRGDGPARRVVDLLVGCGGLVILGPPMAILGLAIRVASPGPALFQQERVGSGERPFTILKFRTMRVESEAGPSVSGDHDDRVTPIGRWLRSKRLDELPQLINLVRGDMTLIGPRPEVPKFVKHYTTRERDSLLVRPGVIGPGAVLFAHELAADLDDVRDPEQYYVDHQLHPKLEFDLDYLHHRTLRADLRLLVAALGVTAR